MICRIESDQADDGRPRQRLPAVDVGSQVISSGVDLELELATVVVLDRH